MTIHRHRTKVLLAMTTAAAAAATPLLLGLNACNNGSISGGGVDDAGSTADLAVFTGPYNDFPQAPVGAGGVTAAQVPAIASAFANATSQPTGGPCISEPTMGALFPSNFNSPLFEWTPPAGHNIFELRFHVSNQVNDLVVYTDAKSFNIADAMWKALAADSNDKDIQVQIRSGVLTAGALTGAVSTGTTGNIRIAPVDAPGAIVYWTTSGGSALKGFRIGDKTVSTVLTPAGISQAGTTTACVGCHISTPDGTAAVFGRSDPGFSIDARLLDGTSKRPSWMTANAVTNLTKTDQALGTMNSAWFSPPNKAILVSALNSTDTGGKYELVATDLAAATGGITILQRMGDTRQAATPVSNGVGSKIAYTSSNAVVDSRVDNGVGEIWTVPFNNGTGGVATPLQGAADSNYNQYYPAYSPGDTFVAFNRIARNTQMYNNSTAEVFLVPGSGGTPVRVAANDPPACTGSKSPGITNSWPHWSPNSPTMNNKKYYWLVFSSTRRPGGLPQLFLSAVVTDLSTGTEVLSTTTPAIFIPNQPTSEANHTPAWDVFKIPVIG
jgi:hypothetical protein